MMQATVVMKFTCRFSKFGSVTKVEIKSKRDIDGEVSPDQLRNSSSVKHGPVQVTETFAFIDLGSGDRGLADCIAGLNNTKWKGKVVRVKIAVKWTSFFLPKAIVGPCTLQSTAHL